MPFIGKDWRSPGGLWVRTGSGWQKLSALRRNLNRHIKRVAIERISANVRPDNGAQSQGASCNDKNKEAESLTTKNICKFVKYSERPKRNYLFLPTKSLSSVRRGKYLTVGEVLCCLDFCTALCDPRCFHYVCKVVELIVQDHFSTLCGSAMKYLFSILEEAIGIAKHSHLFIHRVLTLLRLTKRRMLSDESRHIGCQSLYKCRLHLLGLWQMRLGQVSLTKREEDGRPTLEDLPVECLRFVFQCFSDPVDVVHASAANKHLYEVGSDPLLWEKLFFYHFTEAQLQTVLKVPKAERQVDWKLMFKKLRKRYEPKEEYASMLHQCCHCSCIFWQADGHPCCMMASEETLRGLLPRTKALTPRDLLAIITD